MSTLAILGGRPVRAKSKSWVTWPIPHPDDAKLLAKVSKSGRWSYDGPCEWAFAEAFTKYQTAKYGVCCSNGTVGIQLALEAVGVEPFDEVIVPAMTWQATAAACLDVNAIPILTDIEPDTWCLDLDAVEANITPKTKAIIVVHLYGCMTDLTRLKRICKKHGLFLIEDCAHQHGSFWKNQGVGSIGDVSSWSFQETKTLSCGEGGFNMCRTKEMFYRLYSLRNCGRPYEADPPVYGLKKPASIDTAMQSGNYRITELQAALLVNGLKRLDGEVKHRDANAQYLNGLLAGIPGILPMRRRKEVTQQGYFNFAFRIDTKALKVTSPAFCQALNAELRCGDAFEAPYDPLNKCDLYKPYTKTRHKLDKAYWKAINPKRFRLPVCKEANERSGVVVHHQMLMNQRADMDDVAAAVEKVVDNIDAVRGLKPSVQKKYHALAH